MSDKQPPSPEELQREFEKFFKDKFGGKVQVVSGPANFTQSSVSSTENEADSDKFASADIETFNLKPRDVKNHLDQFVIGQDEAKKALAIAVCDHYNHVRSALESEDGEKTNKEYSKQNVLILGPTGVGKSYLIKHIARLIGVPFVKADATRFSETGYMGANVDDLIKDLVKQADDDLNLAQFGIVYLDEADKLAAAADRVGRDVSGRGVQFGLLKIMEESEVDLRGGNDMASQMQAFMDFQRHGKMSKKVINTRFILFIVSGAFTGLEEIIRKRVDANQIGFATEKASRDQDGQMLALTSTQDLIDFGFEPEFVGRLPIRVACHPLAIDDLYQILKNSKGSIIRQYEDSFAAYGIKATFTDDALYRVAEMAHAQKTGARALMTVCETILRDYKFELPSTYIKELVIDSDVISNPEPALKQLITTAPDQDLAKINSALSEFASEFKNEHGMVFNFAEDAVLFLKENGITDKEAVHKFCDEKFRGFEHGLKLIQQNTGKCSFDISSQTMQHPKTSLEAWIKESYT